MKIDKTWLLNLSKTLFYLIQYLNVLFKKIQSSSQEKKSKILQERKLHISRISYKNVDRNLIFEATAAVVS